MNGKTPSVNGKVLRRKITHVEPLRSERKLSASTDECENDLTSKKMTKADVQDDSAGVILADFTSHVSAHTYVILYSASLIHPSYSQAEAAVSLGIDPSLLRRKADHVESSPSKAEGGRK